MKGWLVLVCLLVLMLTAGAQEPLSTDEQMPIDDTVGRSILLMYLPLIPLIVFGILVFLHIFDYISKRFKRKKHKKTRRKKK